MTLSCVTCQGELGMLRIGPKYLRLGHVKEPHPLHAPVLARPALNGAPANRGRSGRTEGPANRFGGSGTSGSSTLNPGRMTEGNASVRVLQVAKAGDTPRRTPPGRATRSARVSPALGLGALNRRVTVKPR